MTSMVLCAVRGAISDGHCLCFPSMFRYSCIVYFTVYRQERSLLMKVCKEHRYYLGLCITSTTLLCVFARHRFKQRPFPIDRALVASAVIL